MMHIYEISHEKFGDTYRFNSLSDAQEELRKCGPGFENVELGETSNGITDETGDVVGHCLEIVIDKIGEKFGQSGSQAADGHSLVEVHIWEEDEQGHRDGFETVRVPVRSCVPRSEIYHAVESFLKQRQD